MADVVSLNIAMTHSRCNKISNTENKSMKNSVSDRDAWSV
jgi:hypothetical protein